MDTQRTAKTLTALALVTALALFGAACDNENDVTPSTTAQAESAEPTDGVVSADNPTGTDETAYLDAVEGAGIELTGATDEALTLGHSLCEGWDLGGSFDMSVSLMTSAGIDAYDSGSIMGAAALYLCPEHLAAAQAWSEA